MLDRLSRGTRNLTLALIGVLFLWFFWKVRAVLNPLILGYLLAFVVHPLVERLEAKGWSRRASVNLIFSLAGGLTLLLSIGVWGQGRSLVRALAREDPQGPRQVISEAVGNFFEHPPEYLRFLVNPDAKDEDQAAAEGVAGVTETVEVEAGASGAEAEPGVDETEAGAVQASTVEAEVGSDGSTEAKATKDRSFSFNDVLAKSWEWMVAENHWAEAGRAAGGAWALLQRIFGSMLSFFTLLLLLPLYTYFLLFELEHIHGFIRRYLPYRERDQLVKVSREIGGVLSNFFRGRLTVCFLKGAFVAVALALVDVRYALVLGFLAGLFSLIPFVGPLFAFALAFLLGLPDHSLLRSLITTGVVFSLAELIEGYVLLPKILGESLGLHPVVVLVSIMVGGAALGLFGMLVALPLTAAIIILVREFVLPAAAAFADEGKPEGVERPEAIAKLPEA